MRRILWSLPKAAPVLIRHLGAYLELAAQDLARAQRDLVAQLVALAIVIVSALLALVMGCLAIIAVTWNTSQRLTAIVWMAVGFVLIAILAVFYAARMGGTQLPLFSLVRREWQEDRPILERILSSEED